MGLDPFLVKQVLVAAVPPALLGLIVFFWAGNRHDSADRAESSAPPTGLARRIAPTLAMGVGTLVVWVVLQGWPLLPPNDALGWMPWVIAMAMAVGMLADAFPK